MLIVLEGLAAVVVLIVAFLVARAVFHRPQLGVLLVAAFVPLNGLLAILPLPGFVAGWKEGLVIFTLGSAWIRRSRALGVRRPTLLMPWWPAAALFLVFGTASALLSFGVIGFVGIKVTFFYLLLVAILWLAPFDARDRDHLVTILMGMGAFTSLVGIAQLLAGPAALVALGYEYGTQVRTSGGLLRTFSTFNLPFPFGLYVMLSLLVGGAVALANPMRRRNLLFLCASPVMVVAMSSAIVRAALLGLAVGLIYMTIIRFRALGGLLVIMAALVGAILPFVPKITSVFFSSSSLNERGGRWNEVIEKVRTHWLGEGLGSSGAAADRISSAAGENITGSQGLSTNYQPDNYYVKTALELGPIGLWAVIALLVTALIWCTRLSRTLPGQDGALTLGVGASIVAAMFASLVATYFEIFPIDVYFWLLLGVVGCAAAQHESSSGPSPSVPAAAASRHTSASS
ncbi:O-antigen ligase family protein [Rhodococcus sp. BP-349]|uniref:O-antigen ligase family protein n=1 Tax=unclassified Rhodococcus (in: high G+C Gram-positive bacteria) TaxID=192944 RepID=UPI001C9AEA7C|nr:MULTISPECIES: O-antigen ligase family protein [unclassified Rhodococcus (in: high G+C Gram-positive bacteria)]MBY6538331.1 O-antigen ligase family protein [Rhodococcus sp. BP-363]MBY6542668.1 O-antigen ligase family protein [Rhodococcus sp. BP-369]MBY6561898.1 O-antigen ligase family protein [Rhodococcus sp. BP-370]MBY6576190.1 O-antigen ligase family protein [Rhodococcus sp. BP-364]MBY6585491.1 O-antigen ligase family protein [Rhodococcus sp. BP-358]